MQFEDTVSTTLNASIGRFGFLPSAIFFCVVDYARYDLDGGSSTKKGADKPWKLSLMQASSIINGKSSM
jgi:hypothetical protein